jgi:hypothetical protein
MPLTRLRALPTEFINRLAHLLQTLPHERGLKYSERVTDSIQRLPSELKHRSRLSNFFSANAPSPIVKDKLCLVHKALSTALIHEIFTLLSLEVGHHCNSMTRHNAWLSPTQNAAIHQLRQLHSLWLPEKTYVKTFLEPPNPDWSYQKSGCEGCILTRIGSDLQIIVELRALLMSRRQTVKKRKSPPSLLKFVDGWVLGLVGEGERKREIMQGSEMQGEELKIIRKRIWRERRDQKGAAKGKGDDSEIEEEKQDVNEKADEATEEEQFEQEELAQEANVSDFEGEIIDHYAALRSTLQQPLPLQASPARLPTFTTDSSAQTLSTHIEPETPSSAHMSRPKASSMYSFHESNAEPAYEPPRQGWRKQPTASVHANDYRNLLATPTDHSPLRSTSSKKDNSNRNKKPETSAYRTMQDHSSQAPLPIPNWVRNEDRSWGTRDKQQQQQQQQQQQHRPPTPPSPVSPITPTPASPITPVRASPKAFSRASSKATTKTSSKASSQASKPASKPAKNRQTTWSQFCE